MFADSVLNMLRFNGTLDAKYIAIWGYDNGFGLEVARKFTRLALHYIGLPSERNDLTYFI